MNIIYMILYLCLLTTKSILISDKAYIITINASNRKYDLLVLRETCYCLPMIVQKTHQDV